MDNQAISQLKIFRVVRLLRLVKLARVFRASRIFERWESALGLTFAVLKLAKFIFGVMMLSHWMACLWGLVPQIEEAEINWITNDGLPDVAADRYTASLYWAVMTLITIGYGDIPAITRSERLVCVLCMMIGGGTYAYSK